MVWFQSSHGARFWFLISSSTKVCEILELTKSLDEYWTGTCPAQWCSVDLGHVGCQGNDKVKRKEQFQDKDEVIPLPSPKIHSWVNWGCAEQIQTVASVLHPCTRNITWRTKGKALVQKPNNKFSIFCSNFCLARGQMPRCGFAAFAVQQQHIFLQGCWGISAGSWSYPRWPSCGRKQKCWSLNSLERCFCWNSLCQASLLFAFPWGLFGIWFELEAPQCLVWRGDVQDRGCHWATSVLPLLMAPAVQPLGSVLSCSGSWEGFREFVPAAGESLRALEWELCLGNGLKKVNQEWVRLFHSW